MDNSNNEIKVNWIYEFISSEYFLLDKRIKRNLEEPFKNHCPCKKTKPCTKIFLYSMQNWTFV